MRPSTDHGSARRRATAAESHATKGIAQSRGQSSVEYLIVLMLVGISLTTGPRSALEQIFRAVGEHYVRLTDAVSRP